MNNKIVAIIGALVFVVVVAGSGCVGGGSTATDMIKMLPEGDGVNFIFVYYDVQTIRDDEDLHDIYKEFGKILSGIEEELVDIDDVNYIAGVGSDIGEEPNLAIFVGSFDLKDVRDKLEYDLDFDKDEYKGVELWLGEYDKAVAAVAISKDKLIIGDEKQVKNCIKVTKGDRTSIYDNESVRDVLNKLPDGITTTLMTSGGSHGDGALAMGTALMKEDENTLKEKGVVKFDNEDDAIDARADFKREMEGVDVLFDVDVEQKGELIEFSARMDIEDCGADVVVAGSGCIGGGSTATDMIKMVPEGGGAIYFAYVDVQTIRDDTDLRDIYKEFGKSLSEIEAELVDIDDVNYIAGVGSDIEEESNLAIFMGSFDLKDVHQSSVKTLVDPLGIFMK